MVRDTKFRNDTRAKFSADCRSLSAGEGPETAGLAEVALIAPFPIDEISERLAIKIGAQIGAEDIYGAMPILVSGA